ncbi:acyl carrier protein [Anaerolentibacter hominis]|uniref:acyl carrier protein n=1 Tax=Anaerolentibacter hominis TaxID=3079009 RepID=UPI0031B88936
MSVKETILQLINQESLVSNPITETTDLYKDLYFDSLSFVCLLINIEEQCHVTIELSEMADCRMVGQLIKIVENKRVEENND